MKKNNNFEFSDIFKNLVEASSSREAHSKALGRIGYIETVADGVVRARGMADVAYGEMVYFPSGGPGDGP